MRIDNRQTVKNSVDNLREKDIYSLVLFAIYKISEDSKYSTLSQLIYVLEKESLFRLCEYFGGMTIKIPTIAELEDMIYALSIYQEHDINNRDLDNVLNEISSRASRFTNVKKCYLDLCDIMQNYKFVSVKDDV